MKKTSVLASSLLALVVSLSGCGEKGDRALETEPKNSGDTITVNSAKQ